jgi:hypothetical protein
MSIDAEFAIKKDIRNNPIVRGIDPAERREYQRTVRLAALIVLMLLFWAWQHFEIVRNGYAVEKLRREEAAEQLANRQLRLELEMWRAPQLIEQRATTELHLVPASPADIIVIERAPAVSPGKSIVASAR